MEIEGTISNHTLAILIDPGATLRYITPRMVQLYQLTKVKHAKPWLVQLGIGDKRRVTDFIVDCEVKLQDHKTRIDLNILPLGSYNMIIGMDWLQRNKVVLNCFSKTFTYIAEDQILRTIKGILKPVSIRHISAMHLKKCIRKGCKLYAV